MKEERKQDRMRSEKERKNHKKKKNRKKSRGLRTIFLLLFLFLAAAVLSSAAEIGGWLSGDQEITFQVQKGEGTHAIAERLENRGIIHSSLLFRIVSRFQGGDEEWDYGTHTLDSRSYRAIIHELTSPQTAPVKVTLPEGKQVCQMADILEKKGICSKKEFMKACTEKDYSSWNFLKGIQTKKRIDGLEGYLFPDTYYFEKDTDPDTVIGTMLSRFEEKVYTREIRKKAERMDLTVDDLVILASMAESEAVTKADRRTVSGVFLNRLEKDDKLQSCVTVEYAKRMKKTIISLEDTRYDSPYNTYLYKGLPFGPICCPGMESIEAVLYDDDNDYYYFQSDEKGRLHFAVTYQEHVQIQKEVQKDWEVKVTKIE